MDAAEASSAPRLLVVDDQPTILQQVHHCFTPDFEVFIATDGEQALARAGLIDPDLILLDVAMPGLTGLDVCARLKRQSSTKDIPVVFVTAGQGEQEEMACWEAGGADFVGKPINPLTLRKRVEMHLKLKQQAENLRRLALTDGLTGVWNRRAFDELLSAQWQRDHIAKRPLSLMMVDIDYFKHLNDGHGHLAGDQCLRHLAERISELMAIGHGEVARVGGDEFAVLLGSTELAQAAHLAQKLQKQIQVDPISPGPQGEPANVTVSVGIATTIPASGVDHRVLFSRADKLLYQAKLEGRNRIRASRF